MAAKQRSPALPVGLPGDLVVDIVGMVTATSPQPMPDLRRLRVTCKAMYAASKERHVGRRLALERESGMKWRENRRYRAVLRHLVVAGNPEACFIMGLTLVFVHRKTQPGLAGLENAADAGHRTAAYVLGLLLYKPAEGRERAKQYISQVEGEPEPADGGVREAKRTNRESRRCRRLDAVREATWKKMPGPPGRVPVMPEDAHQCAGKGCGAPEGWAEHDVFCSDTCRIRHNAQVQRVLYEGVQLLALDAEAQII